MLPRRTVVFLIAFLGHISGEKCINSEQKRSQVKFYFDPAEWTCFAIPAGCTHTLKLDYKLFDTEEECTIQNMVRMWKSYKLACTPGHSLAVYKRTNGDEVPYIFSSQLCSGTYESEICEHDEVCYTHGGFGYCCKESAFVGTGPTSGLFNFTGLGGRNFVLSKRMVTPAPIPAPKDCNVDGKREAIEWYPFNGMACLSRRSTCNSPGFAKISVEKTYSSQKECMDAHFPNLKMTYRLTCMPGYSAAMEKDVALIFSKDQCGSHYNSDVCNRDEYCAYRNGSPYAFCCARSTKHYIIQYSVYGKSWWRRQKRQIVLL